MPRALPLGDGAPQRSPGMRDKGRLLAGVELLRREHAKTHESVRSLVTRLTAEGRKGSFTVEDVEAFVREGCGACESAKMKLIT